MGIDEIKAKAKRDFDNAVCLMSIIPTLVFVYLLVGKLASFNVLAGEIGYIMLIVVALILLGITTGKKILWVLINRLIDISQQILRMEKELIEKNRLAAISQTILSLSHEINNPLLVIQGNLELLGDSSISANFSSEIKDRLRQVKENSERIMEVTNKMASLSRPEVTSVTGEIKMLDLGSST